MRKLGFFFIFLLGLASCQNVQRSDKPKDLIPEDKMVDILVELSLLQGAKNSNRKTLEQSGINPNEYLWERFNIDSIQFVNSNTYYSENYRKYSDIYELVQERLDGLKIQYDSLREIEEQKADSLQKLLPQRSIEEEQERTFRDSILRVSAEEDSLALRKRVVPTRELDQ